MATQNKGCLSSVFSAIGFVFLFGLLKCVSCLDGGDTNKSISQVNNYVPPSPPITKSDSLEIVKYLKNVCTDLDNIQAWANKSAKQAERFYNYAQEGRTTDYELYKAVKDAKNHFDKAWSDVDNIKPPDKFPDSLKEQFNDAISEIEELYGAKKDAYKDIMESFDNGKSSFEEIDATNENIHDALKAYNNGLARIVLMRMEFGEQYKPPYKRKIKAHPVINEDTTN